MSSNVHDFYELLNKKYVEDFEAAFFAHINDINIKEDKIEFCEKLVKELNSEKHRLINSKNKIEEEPEKVTIRVSIKLVKKKINLVENHLKQIIKEKSSKKEERKVRTKFIPVKKIKIKKEKKIKKVKKVFVKQVKPSKQELDKVYDSNKFYLPFSISQIKRIDEKYNINTEKLIFMLNEYENKKEIYEEIINIYTTICADLKQSEELKIILEEIKEIENIIEKVKRYDFKNLELLFSNNKVIVINEKHNIETENIIETLNSSENIEQIKNEIICNYKFACQQLRNNSISKDIKSVECLLGKLRLYGKKIIKPELKKVVEEEKEEYKKELSDAQKAIEQCIKYNDDIDEYEIIDIVVAFSNFIATNDVIENDEIINRYSDYICFRLVEYMYGKDKIFEEFKYMIDIIKNKAYSYDKDSLERKILKRIYKNSKEIYDVYKVENETKVEESAYFEIIDYWLKDERNYLYIKELLKRKQEVYNIRHNDKHIIIYILDLYVENFKKMIKDKNSDYININYLKEVYFLFTKSYSLRISKEEKEEISLKLRGFRNYVNNTLIKQKRKNAAFDDIKSLGPQQFYKYKEYYYFEDFSDDLLGTMKSQVLNNFKYYVKDKKTTDAFLYCGRAYSIKKEEGNTFLTLYSMDYSPYISRGSLTDRYLEKCEYIKEKVDEFTLNGLSFKKNEAYPVIGYELEFYPSGKIKKLNVKKDIIKITDQYTINSKVTSSEIYELYIKSVSKNGGIVHQFDLYALNEHFEQLLNNMFVEFLSENRLPFIYYGYSVPTMDDINCNMNELINSLHKLKKSDSRDVINIFSSKIDICHYSNLPIPNAVYDFKLIDSFNYLGIENGRMLNDLYFNARKLSDSRRLYKLKLQYLSDYIKKVKELNKSIDYKDVTEISMSKGKIKNRIRL